MVQQAWILLLCPRCLNQVWAEVQCYRTHRVVCSRGGRHPRTEMVEPPPARMAK
jgi:hypothetical protein